MSEDKKPDNIDSDKKVDEEDDQELSDLLDSALKDFSKETSKSTKEIAKAKQDETDKEDDLADTEWTNEFIRQAAEQFESNIAHILKDAGNPDVTPEQVQMNFQRMADAAAAAVSNIGDSTTADTDFASSISQALRGLSEGAENIQNPFSENDIMNMFGGQSEGEQNAFMPFMQGMMQSLLSKEVLYPSLKDILDKYPAWMDANGALLTEEERHKYEQQQEVMKQVCDQLEKEPECITPEQKKVQFDAVLMLMQKLQDFGQPPSELVGDLGPGISYDTLGNPNLNQCSLM